MSDNTPYEIPKFDLTEKIMSEHRKNSAVRRKAPGRKTETSNQQHIRSFSYTTKPPSMLSEQETIIAEIVTRDIERFCASNTQEI